jgi:fumarate reductase flavoprotein subunit
MPDGSSEVSLEADVIVIGGGLAGLSAAVAATEQGADVILLEKASEPGGSFALSGGYVWTFTSVDDYRRAVPNGDADLGRLLVEDFNTCIDWLLEHGGKFEDPIESFSPDDRSIELGAVARRLSPDPVSAGVIPLTRALESNGGKTLLATRARRVLSDLRAVTGVEATSGSQGISIAAPATILATGGFQGNVEMMTRYVSRDADAFVHRAAPGSTGDGLRIALDAGAGASRGLAAFYGHLMPAAPAELEPGSFRRLSQFYSPHAVLIDRGGRRFTDESAGDPASTIALGRRDGATGYLVFDHVANQEFVQRAYLHDSSGADPLGAIEEVGGQVLRAGSIAELAAQLAELGVPAGATVQTLEEFDRAAAAGDAASLDVQRARNLHRISTPPFYAVPVVPGATFTEGGIRVDRECRVLEPDGQPIPGLFAAGADVGAISNGGYAGGLSAALVTGVRAGVHAALEAVPA